MWISFIKQFHCQHHNQHGHVKGKRNMIIIVQASLLSTFTIN